MDKIDVVSGFMSLGCDDGFAAVATQAVTAVVNINGILIGIIVAPFIDPDIGMVRTGNVTSRDGGYDSPGYIIITLWAEFYAFNTMCRGGWKESDDQNQS